MIFQIHFLGQEKIKPYNSHEWSRQNFNSQYQYKIKQTSDEKRKKWEKYKLGNQ